MTRIRSLFAHLPGIRSIGSALKLVALPALVIAPISTASAAVFVSAANPLLTPIAFLSAGSTYQITASGIANLLVEFNNGQGATFNPDGTPTYAFPDPLQSFNPDGSAVDPQNGSSGQAGPGKLFGALVGTFSEHPTSYDQIFTIGSRLVVTATMDEVLFAGINDDYYLNNDPLSGYSVSVSNVPLPASLPLLGFAVLALGAATGARRLITSRRD